MSAQCGRPELRTTLAAIPSSHPPCCPPNRLTSYVFRVFSLAYSIMTVSVIDLPSLCAIARWIITERQAEDGHFLEKGPVIMASMQVPQPPWLGCSNKTQGSVQYQGISGPCPVLGENEKRKEPGPGT